jgi:hypothetical protein
MDTSYFKATGWRELRKLSRRGTIFVPPYVAWELLDHLPTDWGKTQGQIAKLRYVRILDNPMAQFEQFKGADEPKDGWPNEEAVLKPVLDLILRSANQNVFDRNAVSSKASQVFGRASGALEKARDQLRDLEKAHVSQTNDMRTLLINGNATSMRDLSDEFLLEVVKAFCDNLAGYYRQSGGQGEGLELKLLSLLYYRVGYSCLSEHKALREGRPAMGQDYEDTFAFLHIPLDKKVHLYTADKRQADIAIRLARHIDRVKPIGIRSKLWVDLFKMKRNAGVTAPYLAP